MGVALAHTGTAIATLATHRSARKPQECSPLWFEPCSSVDLNPGEELSRLGGTLYISASAGCGPRANPDHCLFP